MAPSRSRVQPSTILGCLTGPSDLGPFVVALLAEGRQQDDPSVSGEPVGNAASCRTRRESQLEQPVAEASRHGIRACEPKSASRSTTTTTRSHSVLLRLSSHSTTSSCASISATRLMIAQKRSSYKSDDGRDVRSHNAHRPGPVGSSMLARPATWQFRSAALGTGLPECRQWSRRAGRRRGFRHVPAC